MLYFIVGPGKRGDQGGSRKFDRNQNVRIDILDQNKRLMKKKWFIIPLICSLKLSKTVLMNKTLYIIFSLKHKGQYFQQQNFFIFFPFNLTIDFDSNNPNIMRLLIQLRV